MKRRNLYLALSFLVLVFLGCGKEDTKVDQAYLNISITDAPGDYENVLLQVAEVAVKVDSVWHIMTLTQPDTFDILRYNNGDMLVISDGVVPLGFASEIRLKLAGDGTLILKDSSTHSLKIPSGTQSGLKIKIDTKNLTSGTTYFLVLDLDIDKSIVKKGNGSYSFKPVVRGFWEESSGAIDGIVLSTNQVTISAIYGVDTITSTLNDSSGYYKMIGLPPGNYSVFFRETIDTTKYQTINNVTVINNQTTTLNLVNL